MAITMSDWYLQNVLRWFPANAEPKNSTIRIRLFTNAGLVVQDDLTAAAFTEADFCGYTPCTPLFDVDPEEDEIDLLWEEGVAPCRFCRTCPTSLLAPSVTVYGWYMDMVIGGETTVWIAAEKRWPDGLVFAGPCDCIDLTIILTDKDITPGHA